MKSPKMMPGQEPYTETELRLLYGLMYSAATAEETFADYELEEFAKKERQKKPIT